MTKFVNLLSGATILAAYVANGCPTVPHGTCTACDTACTEVKCDAHYFDYDGDATNGCEHNYQVATACPALSATIGGETYSGLCLNGWGETCGPDNTDYIQTEDECRQFAQANGVDFQSHGSTWKLGGCAFYMIGNPAARKVFWFRARPIGYVPAQNIRDKEVATYGYICRDASSYAFRPEARSCCADPTPAPAPVPAPTPAPATDDSCVTYTWDFGDGCVGAQFFALDKCEGNTINPSFPLALSEAECEAHASAHRPNWRFYQDPQWGGRLDEPEAPSGCVRHTNQNKYWWNTHAGGVAGRWYRAVCKGLPASLTTADDSCVTYQWDFGNGCVGAQNFPTITTCENNTVNPSFPLPLSKVECEAFGVTHRPSWRWEQDPVYRGEVNDPQRPSGCVKHSNQNLYQWNNAVGGVASRWWRKTCKGEPPVPAPTPAPVSPVPVPTPAPVDPVPVPTPAPVASPTPVTCPSGWEQVSGQNMDGDGVRYELTIDDCATACDNGVFRRVAGQRDCNSFQFSPTVRAGDHGQCWLFQEGAPTAANNRGPDFVFCQRRQATPPAPNGCTAASPCDLGDDGCTPTSPCGAFQGDCDADADCAGNLVCVADSQTGLLSGGGYDDFCQPPTSSRTCQTYESDLFTAGGSCLGVQSFPGVYECPIDFPTPLSKTECEAFGSTRRPTWAFNQSPTYGGEVDDPNRPTGCVKNATSNAYQWNTNETFEEDERSGWQLVCRREASSVVCDTYSRKRRCNQEGGCVWLRSNQLSGGASSTVTTANGGLCVAEDSNGVTCSMLDRQKCRDQSNRCIWGRKVNQGRHCIDIADVDCTALATASKCGRARNACQYDVSNGCTHL